METEADDLLLTKSSFMKPDNDNEDEYPMANYTRTIFCSLRWLDRPLYIVYIILYRGRKSVVILTYSLTAFVHSVIS